MKNAWQKFNYPHYSQAVVLASVNQVQMCQNLEQDYHSYNTSVNKLMFYHPKTRRFAAS